MVGFEGAHGSESWHRWLPWTAELSKKKQAAIRLSLMTHHDPCCPTSFSWYGSFANFNVLDIGKMLIFEASLGLVQGLFKLNCQRPCSSCYSCFQCQPTLSHRHGMPIGSGWIRSRYEGLKLKLIATRDGYQISNYLCTRGTSRGSTKSNLIGIAILFTKNLSP